MNRRRATLAARAGAAGAFVVCAALYFSLVVLALGAYPFGTGEPVVRIASISFVVAAAVAGGAISVRALGAGWPRSAGSAFAAHAVSSVLAFGLLPRLQIFDGWGSYLAIEFILAVTTTILLCVSELSRRGKISVLGVAVFLLLFFLPFENIGSGLIPALAGISCWVILPAVAGLFLE